MNPVSPIQVLQGVADAVPSSIHDHIIVIGSLAAAYQLLRDDEGLQVRTKDVDCVMSPRITAVDSGRILLEQLRAAGWRHREGGGHDRPGTAHTPDALLPAVRLSPPHTRDWFLEVLTVPASEEQRGKQWTRLVLGADHYGLPSFEFLSVAVHHAVATEFGIRCARSEMMALANLLEHPRIAPGLIQNTTIKRSNKDLGRVLAIAWLSTEEVIGSWPSSWADALTTCFPGRWRELAPRVGSGLRELLRRSEDLDQAYQVCATGLLASRRVSVEQLRIAGLRLLQDAVEPVERMASGGPGA